MRWTRDPRRSDRLGCRPGLESLENRVVLSTTGLNTLPLSIAAQPVPAQAPGSGTNSSHSYEGIINAAAVRLAHDIDGSGLTAAVIDTGVGYKHTALGNGFGSGYKVIAGYDFGDSDSDPDATTWNHGTAVAGLIASSDPAYPGVAPGADIVALKVFDSENRGTYEKIADALQWVIDNHQTHRISVVNLSIADGGNYTYDFFGRDGGIGQRIAGLIDELKALKIPVVSAAGNSFGGEEGMGFTAILAETISVTATDSNDSFLSNAQRLGADKGKERATDLAAPGSGLMAPSDGRGFSGVRGTSFSTPLVSGSIILLQSLYLKRFGELPTVNQLESWLEQGSVPVTDPVTGITLPRLDVAQAAANVPEAPGTTSPDADPPGSESPGNPTQPPADTDSPAEDDGSEEPTPPDTDDSPPPPPEGSDSDESDSDESEPTPPLEGSDSEGSDKDESEPTPPTTGEPPSEPSNPPDSSPSPPSDPPSEPPPSEPDPEPLPPPENESPTPPVEAPPPTDEPTPPESSPPESTPPVKAPPRENPPRGSTRPPRGEVTDRALADLYRNGRYVGPVELGTSEDPSRDALAAFGIEGTVRTIHLWSPVQEGADVDPGPAQAAGDVEPPQAQVQAQAQAHDHWSIHRTWIQERVNRANAQLARISRFLGALVRRGGGW